MSLSVTRRCLHKAALGCHALSGTLFPVEGRLPTCVFERQLLAFVRVDVPGPAAPALITTCSPPAPVPARPCKKKNRRKRKHMIHASATGKTLLSSKSFNLPQHGLLRPDRLDGRIVPPRSPRPSTWTITSIAATLHTDRVSRPPLRTLISFPPTSFAVMLGFNPKISCDKRIHAGGKGGR